MKAEVRMTWSIKDVHNITSFYLLICPHKVVIFIPFYIQYYLYSHFHVFQVFLFYASLIVFLISPICFGLSIADLTADH